MHPSRFPNLTVLTRVGRTDAAALMLAGALAVPALFLTSCNDSKTPLEPQAQDQPDLGTTAMVLTTAIHDPRTQVGQKIACLRGTSTTCRRTTALSRDMVELNNLDGDGDIWNNPMTGVRPLSAAARGKLLRDVVELSFSYAGGSGSAGGGDSYTIFLQVPIDWNGDGIADTQASTATNSCNDGNESVGTVDGTDDASCIWMYFDDRSIKFYDNWAAFAAAQPTLRVAKFDGAGLVVKPQIELHRGGTFVIWNVVMQ